MIALASYGPMRASMIIGIIEAREPSPSVASSSASVDCMALSLAPIFGTWHVERRRCVGTAPRCSGIRGVSLDGSRGASARPLLSARVDGWCRLGAVRGRLSRRSAWSPWVLRSSDWRLSRVSRGRGWPRSERTRR
jgi:hypothetical protein